MNFDPGALGFFKQGNPGARSELMGHLRKAQELTDQHQELTGQPGAHGAVAPAAPELAGRLACDISGARNWETVGGPALAFPERRATHRGAAEPSGAEPRARSRVVGVELGERDSTTAWLTQRRVRPRC